MNLARKATFEPGDSGGKYRITGDGELKPAIHQLFVKPQDLIFGYAEDVAYTQIQKPLY